MDMDEETLPPPPYAKITDRFLAWIIDILPFLAGYHWMLYRRMFIMGEPVLPDAWRKILALWAAGYLAYQVLGNLLGATAGKWIMGLRVRHIDGAPLGPVRSILRALGYLAGMPLFNLGFLWALFHPRSQGWHDILADSMVVESEPKSPGRCVFNALCAFAVFAGIIVGQYWLYVLRPTPEDSQAVAGARTGLTILAAIEESYRKDHGSYTEDLAKLAQASGDVGQFKEGMQKLFDPDGFKIAADKGRYELRGRALDRRRTEVVLSGPPSR
ncbi:MAG: RDD family protein [Elusimicrobiota bacterium]|jgi:uncharacterized RDD family membrane protein YckC